MKTYTIRVDARGREVLLSSVKTVKNSLESEIISGDYDESLVNRHEELLQLHRGLLYVRPDAPLEEEPVVGPEAGINQHPRLDELPN
jgi:hypothetical protein